MTHHENLPQGSVTGGEPPLPEDATELAMLVQDERQPKWRRDAAWEKLEKIILSLASRISSRYSISRQLKVDFLANAPTHVWQKLGQFDPKHQAGFISWCCKVLCNYLIDFTRRIYLKKCSKLEWPPEDKDKTDNFGNGQNNEIHRNKLRALESAIDRSEKFCSRDLKRIQTWPLRKRLILLTIAGLWIKIPREQWDNWVQEADYPHPFPPWDENDCDTPEERVALLADYLGMKRNTLSQIWHRNKHLLAELDYISQLRDE